MPMQEDDDLYIENINSDNERDSNVGGIAYHNSHTCPLNAFWTVCFLKFMGKSVGVPGFGVTTTTSNNHNNNNNYAPHTL